MDSSVQPQLIRQSYALTKIFCIVALAISLLSILGWIFKIPILLQWHPSLPVMPPDTAIGIILGASGVWISQKKRSSPLSSTFALTVFLLGLLTLCEYIFELNFGFETFFLPTDFNLGSSHPGRASPSAAFNFLIFGPILFSLNKKILSVKLRQLFALIIVVNSVIAATGYVFSTQQTYVFLTFKSEIGMAIHTSISFILLIGAVFCSRPTEGIMSLMTRGTNSGGMARRILAAGIVAPPIIGVITKIGVVAGWYDVSFQISLFVVIMIGLILWTTWEAALVAEREELRAQETFNALQKVSVERKVYEALIANSSDFIGIADPNLKPTYLNPAGRKMIGIPLDYPVDTIDISDCYPAELRPFVKNVILKKMVDEGKWKGETFFRNFQTNKRIPVSDEHFMINDSESGRVLGHATITREITNIRRLEEGLRQAIKTREEILAIVSHDLKNPLTTVSIVAQFLQLPNELSRQKILEYGNRIESAVDQMTRLISDLQDFARIQSGTFSIEKSNVKLEDIVSSIAKVVRPHAEKKHQHFVVNIQPNQSEIECDGHRIGLVFSNLIGNAIKFTPEGGTVRVTATEEENGVLVSVCDTGPGIPTEQLTKVFDRFWQAEPTKHLGSGLGLYIAKGIVEAHSGRIWAESQIGKGSCFCFTIPSPLRKEKILPSPTP